jgi:hypothetical protein
MRNDVSGRGMLAAILGLVLLAGLAWADPPVTGSSPRTAPPVPRDRRISSSSTGTAQPVDALDERRSSAARSPDENP